MSEISFRYAIGIDRGATNIRAALVRSDGEILNLVREKAHSQFFDVENNICQFASLVTGILNSSEAKGLRIEGIGIGTAGQVNRDGEVVGHNGPRDLKFDPVPLKSLLAQKLEVDLPIFVDNDSKAAAWGEYLFGAGRGSRHMVCLTAGTGIGGGVVVDGKLLHGANGRAGHLGFISVDMHGPCCPSGVKGCVERYASGTGIGVSAREALNDQPESKMLDLAGGQIDAVTSETVFDAAELGDELAISVIRNAGYALGIAVASLLHIFEPDVVVIGGGVADRGEIYLQPVQDAVSEYSMVQFSKTPIRHAELGNLAGVIGAAALCFAE